MRLSPYKARINNADLRQSPQPPQAQRQQLPALQRRRDPVTRGLQPPVAAAAKVDGCFALDAFRDVDVELDAVVAHGDTGGAVDGGAACCAEDSVAGGSVLGVEGWGLGGGRT